MLLLFIMFLLMQQKRTSKYYFFSFSIAYILIKIISRSFNLKDNTREFYISKWRKYLSKETDSKKKLNDPFRILTNLWAHKNVIKDLELIRLNPNLINKYKIRNDLEFYIPQIWYCFIYMSLFKYKIALFCFLGNMKS